MLEFARLYFSFIDLQNFLSETTCRPHPTTRPRRQVILPLRLPDGHLARQDDVAQSFAKDTLASHPSGSHAAVTVSQELAKQETKQTCIAFQFMATFVNDEAPFCQVGVYNASFA